jgi:hypothetical protein
MYKYRDKLLSAYNLKKTDKDVSIILEMYYCMETLTLNGWKLRWHSTSYHEFENGFKLMIFGGTDYKEIVIQEIGKDHIFLKLSRENIIPLLPENYILPDGPETPPEGLEKIHTSPPSITEYIEQLEQPHGEITIIDLGIWKYPPQKPSPNSEILILWRDNRATIHISPEIPLEFSDEVKRWCYTIDLHKLV